MAKRVDAKKLEEELVNLDTQLKRALADYRNLERRVQEDALSVAHHSRAELVVKLLPVLDNLEQALEGASGTDKQSGWFRGVELAVKEFKSVLAVEGLEVVDPKEKLFDPSLYEAVDTQEGPYGMVLEVVKKGYNLNGRVIRPAQVIVGNKNSSLGSNQK